MTSKVALLSFKLALSGHSKNRTSKNELTYTGLRNWVFGEPHQPTKEELAKIRKQEVKIVRKALAEVLEDSSGFYKYMQTIDAVGNFFFSFFPFCEIVRKVL